jgi:catechol 2,3-dioxygenase-like lactoylglutathione lyase family enzyme
MSVMPLCQFALSVTDLPRTHHWYQRAFGFLPAGEKRFRDAPEFAMVPGLPEAAFHVACLVDQQDWFQLEVLEWERPRMRRRPADWRPSDIGYSSMGVHVSDFDAALARILRVSGRPMTAPLGPKGRRRVCLLDPEGVLLELMEDDPRRPGAAARARPEVPVAARSMTLSVRNLERARAFWTGALGLVEASEVPLHTPEHEALWGMAGAKRKSLTLWAGDFLLELVEYADPIGRARPAGYLICDQGILNVALGSQDKATYDAAYRRVTEAGFRSYSPPFSLPNVATVAYFDDDQGISVELLHVDPTALGRMGFVPNAADK